MLHAARQLPSWLTYNVDLAKNLMQDFLSQLKTPAWWIGVVVVGVLINLTSDVLKKAGTRLSASLSERAVRRNSALEAKVQERLEYLRDNPPELVFLALQELRSRIRAVAFLLLGALMFIPAIIISGRVPSYVMIPVFVVSILAILFGFSDHRAAMRLRHLLARARGSKFKDYDYV